MNRYTCVHGHFYQPPRENAWLEAVEVQPTAAPYHDWNERVTAECYWPNCASQILNRNGLIESIVNNYAKINFDFGPTLLSWLETESPDVYQAVIEADRESRRRFHGHGSAMAQAYSHLIMPLANPRDKYTQAVWGIADFEHRFGRKPEGMWLPETAVDLDTLDIIAGLDIKFTVLSPLQAARTRKRGEQTWHDVSAGAIDTTVPYDVRLPSGRSISVFFYQGAVAAAVAFQDLLNDGETFARKLASIVPENSPSPGLAHIATDGESYGHHHRFGDMALAYALQYIERNNLARITNYGEFLEVAPPTHEVEIVENSSWSCAHGVERWRSDCGCSDHFHPGWNQSWRAPLRNAMDWLRDNVSSLFEEKAKTVFKDPWQARDGYIDVVLNRSSTRVDAFLNKSATRALSSEERVTALKLMELQRHAMLMYTSCGWFFDDLARIESVQIIHYAGRVAQLAHELFGDATEARFLERLARAKSNREDYGDGRQIYDRFVKPAALDLGKVAGHYAVRTSFVEQTDNERIYSYRARTDDLERFICGDMDVNFGRVTVTSEITGESLTFEFLVLFYEHREVRGAVRPAGNTTAYEKAIQEISRACSVNDSGWLDGYLQERYGGIVFTLNSLFRDMQFDLLQNAMESTAAGIQPLFYPRLHTYAVVTPLVNDIDNPLPRTFSPIGELVLNLHLRRQLTAEEPDMEMVRRMLKDAKLWQIRLDEEQIGYEFSRSLEAKMRAFESHVENTALIDRLTGLVDLARSLPFPTSLHRLQNSYHTILKTRYEEFSERGDDAGAQWLAKFRLLGEKLSMKLP